MAHISAADAPTFDLPGCTVTGLAAPSRGSTQTSVWTLALEAGFPPQLHHMDQEEVFVAVAGAAVATLGDDQVHVAAGDARRSCRPGSTSPSPTPSPSASWPSPCCRWAAAPPSATGSTSSRPGPREPVA